MQNNKRRNGLTHVRVNFSQSEKSLLPSRRGGVKILVTTGLVAGGGVTENFQKRL